MEEFVKQASPVPLRPCKHTLYSNLALSPEASSGCLNRNKLFAAPSRSLRKVFLFNILKTRLFAPCSPQQFLGLQPATGSPGVVSLLVTPHLTSPHSLHSSREAVTFPTPPAATRTRQTGRFLLPACLHLFEVQTPVDYKQKQPWKRCHPSWFSKGIQNNHVVSLFYFTVLKHQNQMQSFWLAQILLFIYQSQGQRFSICRRASTSLAGRWNHTSADYLSMLSSTGHPLVWTQARLNSMTLLQNIAQHHVSLTGIYYQHKRSIFLSENLKFNKTWLWLLTWSSEKIRAPCGWQI